MILVAIRTEEYGLQFWDYLKQVLEDVVFMAVSEGGSSAHVVAKEVRYKRRWKLRNRLVEELWGTYDGVCEEKPYTAHRRHRTPKMLPCVNPRIILHPHSKSASRYTGLLGAPTASYAVEGRGPRQHRRRDPSYQAGRAYFYPWIYRRLRMEGFVAKGGGLGRPGFSSEFFKRMDRTL